MTVSFDIKFRLATLADLAAIVQMLAEDNLGAQRESLQTPLPRAYIDAFETIDKDPNHELIVAEINGAVIGTLQLTFIPSISFVGGTRAQVESVRVAGSFRGQGIGVEMMKWAIERARQRGCHLMQLTSHKSRKDAHRFYERLGFTKSHIGMKIKL